MAFYCGKLGFQLDFQTGESDPCYIGVSREGCSIHLSSHADDGVAGGVVLFLCDEVDSLYRELVAKSVAIDAGPVDQTWGMRELYVKDPDGNSVRFGAAI
jgi:catechol 2,3-dioxygenase-like lactoylglutathione lyase family enzyme